MTVERTVAIGRTRTAQAVELLGALSDNVETKLTPQHGDLVVTYETRSAARYTVRQHPQDAQLSMALREEAIRLAQGFARTHAVDIWYSENGTEQLLETNRARTAVPEGPTPE
jgi:hypothetical protein